MFAAELVQEHLDVRGGCAVSHARCLADEAESQIRLEPARPDRLAEAFPGWRQALLHDRDLLREVRVRHDVVPGGLPVASGPAVR